MRESKLSYWNALLMGVLVGVVIGLFIIFNRHHLKGLGLSQSEARLWEIVLKAIAGYLAIIGAVITAFKYIDDRAEHRQQTERELRRPFIEQRQAVYIRLGLSLAGIMNLDPDDGAIWNRAKEDFYRIRWGEIPLVADGFVMKTVEVFSNALHLASSRDDKERLGELRSAIVEACRASLGDAWSIDGKSATRDAASKPVV